MSRPLQVYFGGSASPNEFSYVAACFAHTARDARKLMWARSGRLCEDCYDDFTMLRVVRQRGHDALAAELGVTEPQLITDDSIQRDLGWSLEGDDRCEQCERATFDGDYPLCDECRQCADCGHASGCAEHAQDSAPGDGNHHLPHSAQEQQP